MGWIDQALTRQFYLWELRGRGWQVFDAPVSIEPRFQPFFGHFIENPPEGVDDGRRETIGSRIFSGVSRWLQGPPTAASPESEPAVDEDGPFYENRSGVIELQLTLPDIKAVSGEMMHSWLLSLSACREPLAFEIVAGHAEIVVQIAVCAADASVVMQQTAAHFPAVSVIPVEGHLDALVAESGRQLAIIEFGLSREFMVPLAVSRSDIFVSMVAAMGNLAPGESAIFQVIFEPVRHAWAESAIRAVTDNEGGPFFSNRPELVRQVREKVRSPIFATVMRIAALADDDLRAMDTALNVASSLRAFSSPDGNELKPLTNDDYPHQAHAEDLVRRQSRRTGMLLNSEELIGFVHLPTSAVAHPKLRRDTGRTRATPGDLCEEADLMLGVNVHAGQRRLVWLRSDHRVRHMHVIGGSGCGKTTFLFNCIRQDIENGIGCAVLDPHGDLVERLLDFIPRDRLDEVVLFDPTDEVATVGLNILAAKSDFEKDLISSDLVAVFRRQSTSWGEQMDSVLHHAIQAFLESDQGGTIADMRNFLLDAETRRNFLRTVRDPDVRFYWEKGFPQLGGTRSIGPVVTRLEKFLSRKPVKRAVSQRDTNLDFADIMDNGKIFLAKLPQGQIGAENAFLLGTLLVSKFQQMAMARQRMREDERREFFLYIDEAANFLTPSMTEILAGARKYRLGLVLAHQSLSQFKAEPQIAGAIEASACTRMVFRVSDQDARALSDGFAHFEANDIQRLGVGEAICRVERSDVDFNLTTLPSMEHFEGVEYAEREEVIARSRELYASAIEIEQPLPSHADEDAEIERPIVKTKRETAKSESTIKADEAIEAVADESLVVEDRVTEPSEVSPPVEVAVPSPTELPPVRSPKPYVPAQVRADLETLGRGGDQHRLAQNELKAIAESLGFRATIERQLPGTQETVDLYLQLDDQVIGCEISVTNTLDYEVRNVLKLLRAGITTVVMVALDAEKLTRLDRAIRSNLSADDSAKVRCFLKEQFIDFLQSIVIASPAPVPEPPSAEPTKKVKGWKVKRTVVELSPEELREREAEIAATIADNMRRRATTRE